MVLSEGTVNQIKIMQQRMPTSRAALLFALRATQAEKGRVGQEEVLVLSDLFGISPMQVEGVARFYDLLSDQVTGPNHIRICEGVVCVMRGADGVWDALAAEIFANHAIQEGLSIERSACLGHCDHAPAALVNDALMGPVISNKLDVLIGALKREATDAEHSE